MRPLAQARAEIDRLFVERELRLAHERANYRAHVPLPLRPFAFFAYHGWINPERWFWRTITPNLNAAVSARRRWKQVKLDYEWEAVELTQRLLSEILSDRAEWARNTDTAPAADQAGIHALQKRETVGVHPTGGTPPVSTPYFPDEFSIRGIHNRITDAIRLVRTKNLYRGIGWHSWSIEGAGPLWVQPVSAIVLGVIAGLIGLLTAGPLGLLAAPLFGALPFLLPQRGLLRKIHPTMKIGTPFGTIRAGSQAELIQKLKELNTYDMTENIGRYTGIIVGRQREVEVRTHDLPAVLNYLKTYENEFKHMIEEKDVEDLLNKLYGIQVKTRKDVPTPRIPANRFSKTLVGLCCYVEARLRFGRISTEEIDGLTAALSTVHKILSKKDEAELQAVLNEIRNSREPSLANARSILAAAHGRLSPSAIAGLAFEVNGSRPWLSAVLCALSQRRQHIDELGELIARARVRVSA
ncbi:MAG: hypothetical protein QXG98_00895 [Candidatus Micrarchaeia archaeon]